MIMKEQYNCIVMGAAGRDFHVYLSFLRGNPHFRVMAFTATQIPFITERSFPRSLAGPDYDTDIPIYDESELPGLIEKYDAEFVFFAYSDISHAELMHNTHPGRTGMILFRPARCNFYPKNSHSS